MTQTPAPAQTATAWTVTAKMRLSEPWQTFEFADRYEAQEFADREACWVLPDEQGRWVVPVIS